MFGHARLGCAEAPHDLGLVQFALIEQQLEDPKARGVTHGPEQPGHQLGVGKLGRTALDDRWATGDGTSGFHLRNRIIRRAG